MCWVIDNNQYCNNKLLTCVLFFNSISIVSSPIWMGLVCKTLPIMIRYSHVTLSFCFIWFVLCYVIMEVRVSHAFKMIFYFQYLIFFFLHFLLYSLSPSLFLSLWQFPIFVCADSFFFIHLFSSVFIYIIVL